MIATVIKNKTYEEILRLLDDPWIELAEIRLDLCELSDEEIEDIFANTDTPLIATCRCGGILRQAQDDREAGGGSGSEPGMRGSGPGMRGSGPGMRAEGDQDDRKGEGMTEEERWRRLSKAIESGARYADLELEAPVEVSKRFRELCHEYGTEIIRSYHNYECTPSAEELRMIQARCYRYGADIAKIVTMASGPEDVGRVMGLYGEGLQGRLVAFAMGEAGRESRIECLKRGAPFSYAALDAADPAAPGQYGFEQMHALVYGDVRGFWRVGDLPMPASKSFAQRAILAAALAEGCSHLRGYTPCDDSESAIRVARAFGAKVRQDGSTLVVDGIGVQPGTAPLALKEICVGESGLLTRLSIPLLAAINSDPVKIGGEKTLLERPLKGMQNIMASFGVPVRSETVPLVITPPLIPGNAEISGKGGSQLISGLLMALPLCAKNSTVYVSEPKSIPYMFITEDILRKFGVRIKSEMEGDERMIEQQDWTGCSQITFSVKGGQHYKAADIDLEGDWSAAANFLVAGAIFGKAEVSGLATDSLQADLSIADILVQAGAVVSELDGAVCVSKAPLEGFDADLANAPDLFPICSVLAAFCDGVTTLHGVSRLHGKESDRASAIMEMLEGLGVEAKIEEDALLVRGETFCRRLVTGRLLRGGTFRTRHDHRMAMALKIASMGASSPVVLDDTACVSKSFPGFWELFDY